jgi:hypothetical protein
MVTIHRRLTLGLDELRNLDDELKSMARRKGEKADTRRIKQIRLRQAVLIQQGLFLRISSVFFASSIISGCIAASLALTTITGNPQSEQATLIAFYISIALLTLGALFDVIEINLEYTSTRRYLLGGI